MKMNGTRKRLLQLAHDPVVPIELHIGSDRIDVWLDHSGIHFRQGDGRVTEGHLPWDVAIAMSLLPAELRPRAPAA